SAKVVHLISDMREVDWSQDGEAIAQAIRELTEGAGAKVHLIDVATPYRKPERKVPAFSDNVGIIAFKPRSRVVGEDHAVEFEPRVKNFGGSEVRDVDVWFYLNGRGNLQTIRFDSLPANQERTQLVSVTFNQTATKEDPLAAFNLVTARLAPGITGDALAADNVRHAIVEVREKLAV